MYAVCCVDESATKILDAFLTIAFKSDSEPGLTIITNLSESYTELTHPPVLPFKSPFLGKTYLECSKLICDMTAKTDSDIDHGLFVVLDQRSTENESAVLVGYDNEGEKIESIRVGFEAVNTSLLAGSAKGWRPDVKERAERSEAGVMRDRALKKKDVSFSIEIVGTIM